MGWGVQNRTPEPKWGGGGEYIIGSLCKKGTGCTNRNPVQKMGGVQIGNLSQNGVGEYKIGNLCKNGVEGVTK